ncbi:TonB-dependent receptor [Sphingomonas sp.]|jgi:TonB-dependent receptor|uniref:TonB-dependent receptor n=1 Tax=Sphingomonas sp. TaxID=28214 RepID=UPI002615940E|nr:TonB-dependent receptor [Sphingomonas sp.]MDF2604677.1 TonB-dependent receptor [Sphingomonas sp.]
MGSFAARSLSRLVIGASVAALATAPGMAWAQDAAATVGSTGPAETPATASEPTQGEDDIVVTGIRASLRQAVDIKRDAQGVVDAISAEDMGKFPDTNLAESLQRITGVSIDRSNGEGSFVTVRGFGPEYNLVTLNGRQMPTSTLGDGASAPASRSFDFANLASEGVSAVEVYKTGRASVPSGGIGSSINIRTPRPLDRPGMRGSLAARGVLDTSQNGKNQILPEVSGIFSTTFADDRIGIMVNGVYQRRKASANEAFVGFRDGFLGATDDWGTLPRNAQQVNRPGATDIYEIPQEASYNVRDIDRERINGQAVLQVKPTDTLTATADFTYSRNKVEVRNNSVGVWFNFGDVSSEWADGPVAAPVFYSEAFGAVPAKDLSYSAALSANVSENKSTGFNLNWEAPGGVTVSFDAHHSTAESKPTNDYGTSTNIGGAVFGLARQTIDFRNDLPIISYAMQPGIDPLNASLATPTGNSFRNAYFRNEINQFQLKGRYEHDGAFLDSIDFGFSYIDNDVRSAYGFIQNETWSGIDPRGPAAGAAAVPDDFWKLVSLPDKFRGVQGAGDASMPQQILAFNFEQMAELLRSRYNICSNPQTGTVQSGTCLADYTTDRRLGEKTMSPYLQVNTKFDLLEGPAHIIAGIRYDQTTVRSESLIQVPTGTRWTGANEFALTFAPDRQFSVSKGSYQNWLPSIDFDMEPIRNVKLRASYSHTITRADYGSLQGGLELASNPRIGGGTGTIGNPNLVPFKSKNIDLSAEWYYGQESYISVGYFNKDVQNYIGTTQLDQSYEGLRNPGSGPRARAAAAALGTDNADLVRDYILRNYPGSSQVTGRNEETGLLNGNIFGLPEDDLFNFQINQPFNSDQTANINGWEFAIQHRFWDTGFGTILNYTIVNGDAQFNNALDPTISQFALVGLSDSANAVLFFDKFGFQARAAYNWRAEFLNSNNGFDPTYVEAYGQLDASVSYEFMRGLTVFGEGINLTGESRRGHRRSDDQVTFSQPGFARYMAGVRFNF